MKQGELWKKTDKVKSDRARGVEKTKAKIAPE